MYCPNCGTPASPNQKFCIKCGANIGAPQTVAPIVTVTKTAQSPYAGFWRRAAAFLIDYVLLALLFYVAVPLMVASAQLLVATSRLPAVAGMLVNLFGSWLYFAGFESSRMQATVGKVALGIRVTDVAGCRVSFARATGRAFARIFSAIPLCIGYFAVAFTKRRQAFHDMIAGTLVVRKAFSAEDVAGAGPAPSESGAMVAIIVAAFAFVGLAVIGILAAIAIPAYQNYTIRAQVTEGLSIADSYKTAVSEALDGGQEPSRITSETLQTALPTSGSYVDTVKVVSGAIVIKYGRAANPKIAGKLLVIAPSLNSNRDIIWVCGKAPSPPDATPALANASQYTTVAVQYLPSSCHD